MHSPASNAYKAAFGIIAEIDRIGERAKTDQLRALAVVLIRADFLFKAEPLFFAVGLLKDQGGVQSEIVTAVAAAAYGILRCGIGVRELGEKDRSAAGSACKELMDSEQEKSDHGGDEHPHEHSPAFHSPLGRIGLMVVIVGERGG